MKEYVWMDFYETGIETGVLSIQQVRTFLDIQVERCDPIPYIYLEAYSAAQKSGRAFCMRMTDYFADNRYLQQCEPDCAVEKALIYEIKTQYESKNMTCIQAIHALYNISLCYEPHSILNILEDYWELASENFCYSIEQVQQMLEEILQRGQPLF